MPESLSCRVSGTSRRLAAPVPATPWLRPTVHSFVSPSTWLPRRLLKDLPRDSPRPRFLEERRALLRTPCLQASPLLVQGCLPARTRTPAGRELTPSRTSPSIKARADTQQRPQGHLRPQCQTGLGLTRALLSQISLGKGRALK